MIVENQPDFSERLLEEQIIKFQFTFVAIALLFRCRGFEGVTRSCKDQTSRACSSCATVTMGSLGTKKSSGLLREEQSCFCFTLRSKKSAA